MSRPSPKKRKSSGDVTDEEGIGNQDTELLQEALWKADIGLANQRKNSKRSPRKRSKSQPRHRESASVPPALSKENSNEEASQRTGASGIEPRTIRFAAEEVTVYPTHSPQDYDRTPNEPLLPKCSNCGFWILPDEDKMEDKEEGAGSGSSASQGDELRGAQGEGESLLLCHVCKKESFGCQTRTTLFGFPLVNPFNFSAFGFSNFSPPSWNLFSKQQK